MSDLSKIVFEDFVDNCEVLKEQYSSLLVPFFNVRAIRCWKKMIYSLDMRDYKKDLLWEVLNDDISIEQLRLIVQKNKKK